jgi:hypothetical protein
MTLFGTTEVVPCYRGMLANSTGSDVYTIRSVFCAESVLRALARSALHKGEIRAADPPLAVIQDERAAETHSSRPRYSDRR